MPAEIGLEPAGEVHQDVDVGRTREMSAQDHDQRRGLGEVVEQFVADANLDYGRRLAAKVASSPRPQHSQFAG